MDIMWTRQLEDRLKLNLEGRTGDKLDSVGIGVLCNNKGEVLVVFSKSVGIRDSQGDSCNFKGLEDSSPFLMKYSKLLF